MARQQLGTMMGFIRDLAARRLDDATDGQLLERFTAARDETALTALIQRHGLMVLCVCRRILRHEHDAEDAFQATFLALLSHAGSIRKKESVSSWLHGAAYRIASRARVNAARRQAHQRAWMRARIEARMDAPASELSSLLDEEVNRLPEKYRDPFVLCYLEGRSNEDAARLLNCPIGTIFSRLAWARKRLRVRLGRCGIKLMSGIFSGLLVESAHAEGVPNAVADRTLQAALFKNLDQAIAAGLLSKTAAMLTLEVGRTMLVARVKVAFASFLTLAVAAAGATALAHWPREDRPAAVESRSADAPQAADKKPKKAVDQKIQAAIARAVAFLKLKQVDGNWEKELPGNPIPGGISGLVMLALLESGLPPDKDPAIRAGLEYLRKAETIQTYALALQTMVFCRAGAKEDTRRIQRNVNRLLELRIRDAEGRFCGWTYSRSQAKIADNSNTHYALMALDAAQRAGAKVEDKVWQDVQSYYLRTQVAEGGWCYNYTFSSGQPTATMTCAGLHGLLMARKHLNEPKANKAAIEKGFEFLEKHLKLNTPINRFYRLHTLAVTGRMAEKRLLTVGNKLQFDWYQEGAGDLLREQREDGSWNHGREPLDGPIISTSFALLFLSKVD